MTEHNPIATQPTQMLSELSVAQAVERFSKIEELAHRVLKEGREEGTGDYGIVPGTKRKVLFKSGAEKLCTVFRIGPEYQVELCERDDEFATYTVRCTLRHQPTGAMLGSALGLCTNRESKYRYRHAGRSCPKCHQEAIIKGRAEYGGGWLCFTKRGGCGAKYDDNDSTITDQTLGRVENEDLADLDNTILKMAEKRAFLAAVLNVLGISSMFTQDLQEGAYEPPGEPETSKPPPEDQATGLREDMDKMLADMIQQMDSGFADGGMEAVSRWWKDNHEAIRNLPAELRARIEEHGMELRTAEEERAKAIQQEGKEG